jgi:hypothetical protein
MQREIDKLPAVPDLTENVIKTLNELCFREDSDLNSHVSDTIFVFGTAVSLDRAAEALLQTVKQISPKKLIITGGMPTYQDSYEVPKPESELLYDLVKELLPNDLDVMLEKTSNSCIENVQYALSFLQDSQCITYITKSFGAGRDYLTLKKFLPNVHYTQKTFDAFYPESSAYITKADWHLSPYSISRVWGEFLRIVKYGSRGDIAYDEIKNLVDNILMKTHVVIP